MSKRDIKAVVFDIDGTLTSKQSWQTITESLGASQEELHGLYKGFIKGDLSWDEVHAPYLHAFQKSPNANKNFITKTLQSIPLRRGAKETVKYLKSKYHLLIITGAMDIYAEIVSKQVGIDEYRYNSIFYWNKDGTLKDWDEHYPQEELKLKQLDEFCKKKGITREQCAPVGDSWNDVGLFDATGNGVFIESDFEEPMLEKHSWRTVHELAELKNFL